jgi:hypothetical protein
MTCEQDNASMYKIWLLKLILPMRYGRTLTGLLLLSLLSVLFFLSAEEADAHRPPALFFSLIIAYIIPVFSFITTRAQEALNAMRPILVLDEVAFEDARTRLDSARLYLILGCLFGGILGACAHLSFIRGSFSGAVANMVSDISGLVTGLGTVTVWVVMTTVISMLMQQAILFSRLGGGYAHVSLLDIGKLRPFARVSISSSLAVIGALALFPLINLQGGLNLAESLPGVFAILGPLVIMFIIPVWPLHRRLVRLKAQELARLQARIALSQDAAGEYPSESADIDRLLPLLQYRREIAQLSTWPFDLGNITTFAFYLVIPPLTWAGAALIENLVNFLL